MHQLELSMPKKFTSNIRPSLRELLLAQGFKFKVYEHVPGEHLSKLLVAKEMPHFRTYGIDNQIVFPESEVLLEVTPDERVQLVVQRTDSYEQPTGVFRKAGLLMLSNAGLSQEQVMAVK